MARVKHSIDPSSFYLDGFDVPDGLVPVALFEDFREAGDSGLVILAMGKAYWTFLFQDHYVLCVSEVDEAPVRTELEAVAGLSGPSLLNVPKQELEFEFGWLSFAHYAFLLTAFFVWQQYEPVSLLGRADAVAMMEGREWWRAVTALTLHADIVHLVSNLAAGMGFAFFLARFFGAASAWLLILLSGIIGNALNAWVYYPEPHLSLGASTAVFGALGLLTGVGTWMTLALGRRDLSSRRWLMPILAGAILLGLLGVGGENVDVSAHISGFISGLSLGFLAALRQRFFLRLEGLRLGVGLISILTIAAAWLLAFR